MSILTSNNAAYHADKQYLSSSGMKLLLLSAEAFYEKYIAEQPGKASDEAKFVEGSFVHTLLLEPEKVMQEYAVFEGLRRQGKTWEDFKIANAEKTILTSAQVSRCEALAQSVMNMQPAADLLKNGLSEHTMISQILDVPVKARADYINLEKQYIVDVKTTSMPSDPDFFKLTVEEYGYALSAALYCRIAEDSHGKAFDFYWIVVSKADKQAHVYKASSLTLATGSTKVIEAVVKYKRCLEVGDWRDASLSKFKPTFTNYEVIEI